MEVCKLWYKHIAGIIVLISWLLRPIRGLVHSKRQIIYLQKISLTAFFGHKKYWSKKTSVWKKWDPKSLFKIGLVTAEKFLIWTNVARTNVPWKNVTFMGGIRYGLWNLCTFEVWSKSGQLQLTYSWWTNVARTNVIVTVEIYYWWSREPIFKWSKLSQ